MRDSMLRVADCGTMIVEHDAFLIAATRIGASSEPLPVMMHNSGEGDLTRANTLYARAHASNT